MQTQQTKPTNPGKVHIEVTQEDISEGQCRNAFLCMVARAVSRATGWPAVSDWSYVGLFNSHERLHNEEPTGQEFAWAKLPEGVTEKIIAYDTGQPVEPFSFDLEFKEVSRE